MPQKTSEIEGSNETRAVVYSGSTYFLIAVGIGFAWLRVRLFLVWSRNTDTVPE